MNTDYQIPEPFIFNPLKHHLRFIREYINSKIDRPSSDLKALSIELKRLGTSVMDVYTGSMTINKIYNEVEAFLNDKNILSFETYSVWAGVTYNCFRVITLSDGSQWTLKFHNNQQNYVHIFPARNSPLSFRVKSNTLKSAVLYNILIGKDLVTPVDLNKVRPMLGLSPIKDTVDAEAILEMIEIIRG